ncbi:ras GTPase-activating protein 3 isoform X2 [Lingula anatina]|uniref:Ras GTPase-activating protein 3 isoform X2 n=1 Tax=Lingula anatina TaxID=7574 RepID=A0A1S3IS43_LINAN|nr:ras GTPase-activating protein 3 isoform X2 [Lingula anatina]|eukprot:XP_013401022.2 ras GTPase-activating protein 3 isoform X2 [Lingula anatina]
MEGGVRIQETLRVKIGEAKHLPPSSSNVTSGLRDTYCSVALDQEQIFKTSLIERNLNPFYGEEFQCEIPRKFRFLKFYVHEKTVKQDKIIGNVVIKKEELHKYHGKDHWLPLHPVDALSEVQGKVHVELRLSECLDTRGSHMPSHRLSVRVVECSDLTVINGACNPYAEVTLTFGKMQKNVENKRTAVKKKTICPQFDETFFFDLKKKGQNHDRMTQYIVDDSTNAELSISLWHDDSRVSREVLGHMFPGAFLGEVKILLKDLDQTTAHNAWYFLSPRESSSKKHELGSLRLKISYTADHVFLSHYYNDLRNLLLKSPEVQPITSSAAYILGEVVEQRQEAAQPLVKVFLHHEKLVPLIEALSDWEISRISDPNTIFRGNTLASKCIDELMKVVGMHYLHDTLKAIIDEIFDDHLPCEVDPTRLSPSENLDNNINNLRGYIEKIIVAITQSALQCPTIMCQVFAVLKEIATKYFPENKAVRYQVVSGFIFLRFYAPAILGPKLFQLRQETPDQSTSRKLTLISKAVQSLGNLVSSKHASYGFKEDYMVPLFRSFSTEHHTAALRTFLDIVSTARTQSRTITTTIVLKEGMMTKRAQGRRRFGVKNFKRRYFCLTNQYLSYAKSKDDEPLCEIPVDEILAVETVEEESFKMKYMFQVVQPQRTLYIQANNCVEMKEWTDILSKICEMNENRLHFYHPAGFVNGHYLCCNATEQTVGGCAPVTSELPDIKVVIDPDLELERIHSLFLSNMEKLEKLQDTCAELEVYSGTETPSKPPTAILEDTKTCFETLSEILACVISLEQEHKQYVKDKHRNTVYGSQETPIGDENYLLMSGHIQTKL